jgi:hypothetical protein
MKSKLVAADAEARLLADVSVDVGWSLIERFATLNRESGSADESAAADYIVSQLQRLRIPHDVHQPQLYLSLPRSASVDLPGGVTLKGKPPAFAASTGPEGLTAPIVHVPAFGIKDVADLFEDHRSGGADVRGKIVVSEGYAMPLVVERFERAGAVGQVFINPGKRVHWGICTPIWGAPSDKSIERKPRTPVLAINRPDGDHLTAAIRDGLAQATINTALEEGWYRCKLPVARIAGGSDDFMLVHGHYDSWDVGIGDNAVGDATLLELARIFHAHRKRLRRSLLVAWWPGHSMGRYAGSTWFADRFAMDLRERCLAALNIDSPGCWHATAYDEVMWMAEADDLCRRAIKDATGVTPHRLRPIRAGDYSFNQLGLTSFFMLLSHIPQAERDQLGFYPVGGCGGNTAWHTEDDLLPIADRDNLARDLKVYVTAILRVLNAGILPLDYRATLKEIAEAVDGYRKQAGQLADFAPIDRELRRLKGALNAFYAALPKAGAGAATARANDVLRELARLLVPINYSAGERFDHDPALPLGTVPRLAAAARLENVPPEQRPFLQAGLVREINKVANALHEAWRLVRRSA